MEMLLERWTGDAAAVVQGAADMISWILLAQLVLTLALALLVRNTLLVRRFWCALAHREVEVLFERPPLAIPPGRLAVRRCSACDPPSAIGCERRCEQAEHRLPCAPPIFDLIRQAGPPRLLGGSS